MMVFEKLNVCGFVGFLLFPIALLSQPAVSAVDEWKYNLSLNQYIFSDAWIFNPVITADHRWLHLEGRYNYEDLRTASLFAGYSIETGGTFSVNVIPMVGLAIGQTQGIIPALEFTMAYGAFEWYNESEYVIPTSANDDGYFYAWSELTYSPVDGILIGLAGSRTRLFQTDVEIQRGLGLGYYNDRWYVSGYVMNLGFEQPFVYFSISLDLP